MNENDDQMQKLEAGLRDHIIAWQAANPDKALDTSALQRTGTEYMASQVLGGDWDFGLDDVQDAPDVQGAASTPPAAAQAGDAKDGADTGQPGDDVVTSNTPGWADGGNFVQVGQPVGDSNPSSPKASLNPANQGASVASGTMADQGARNSSDADEQKAIPEEPHGGDDLNIKNLRLIAKLPDKECALLEQDIGLEKGTINKLKQMMKEGKGFESYGLVPHADSEGHVNEIIGKKSQTYQKLLEALEGDTARTWSDKIDRLMAAIASGSYNKGSALVEKNRSEKMLKDMHDVFDNQCKK